jgi:hypothetical protein
VGTFEEVRACLLHTLSTNRAASPISPELVQLLTQVESTPTRRLREILALWNPHHFVPRELADFLRSHLFNVAEELTC